MFLDIIAIIISVISLLVSAFFTFWNSRPHIKIKLDASVYSQTHRLVAILVKYHNPSPVAGCIKSATISIKNKKFPSIEINETFDTSRIELRKINGNKINITENQFRTPISILPYQSGIGAFVFPNINPDLLQGKPIITFYAYKVGSWRFRKTVRPIRNDYTSHTIDNNYT